MLPEARVDYLPFKYKCPKCKRGSETKLPFAAVGTKVADIEYQKKCFCSNRYCESQHHFTYMISVSKGSDERKIKVSKFFVDNEEGKVQVLA